ncbi:2'-5' RNA ligase family protein [Ulvibacterium marinum]|uniref:2'-5' RNA ligase family protein n=1 Tax=Ulvibacterium marinum TaxID=2419782 RepID=A0A3B0C7M4_9FLAO|nr:2'-5' RNA ligase family protein [Ulvibacterium marinum]RKN81180.1 2'-5' RNA ligase family protein [Ulvibacterium marinum]
MKQLRLPLFTSKIKYYNLRIVPPDLVFENVTALKKQFEFTFGKQPLSRSKPHITIASFKMNSKYQDLLIQVFDQLSQRETFKLHIDGFDVFESSKTLYLKVPKKDALTTLHGDLQVLYDKHLKGRVRSFAISENPHMTISKTRGKKMLYQSLHHFQNRGYSRQIDVDHLTLVSRSKYRTWEEQHEIRFDSSKGIGDFLKY